MNGTHRNLVRVLLTMTVSFFVQSSVLASTEVERVVSDLKYFRFQPLNGATAPCAAFDCLLAWGTIAVALGDVGAYARRVGVSGMDEYARSIGVQQNFLLLKQLEVLPPALPYHIATNFRIKIKNIAAIKAIGNDEASLALDSRPIIEAKINDLPMDAILDSGAALTIPADSPAAKSLDVLPLQVSATSGTGSKQVANFSTAKKVKVGDAEINNLMATLGPKIFVGSQQDAPIGLIGSDLLLRFDAVTVDLINGSVEFNPTRNPNKRCAPMEFVVDKNKMLAGLAVMVNLAGVPMKARIDTGGNADIVLHGSRILANTEFHPTEIKFIDGSGNLETLEHGKASITLGSETSMHNVLRTAAVHPDFDITLGAKFFFNRSFTFDFRHHEFCLNSSQ